MSNEVLDQFWVGAGYTHLGDDALSERVG